MKKHSLNFFILPLLLLAFFVLLTSFLIKNYSKQAQNRRTSATANTDLYLNIIGGSLSQTVIPGDPANNQTVFSSINIDSAPASGVDTTANLVTNVRDHRGLALGWTQTATCTDFIKGANSLSVTNLTIEPSNLTPVGNSNVAGLTLGSTHTFLNDHDSATILLAAPGGGFGRYQVDNLLTLHIPKTTTAGIYTAVMTLTIS